METKFKGMPVKLAGKFVHPGITAPDFTLAKADLGEFSSAKEAPGYLLLNIFPSIDTSVCSTSVRKFNEMAAKLPNTQVLCISRDLPFAQGRFCAAEGIKNVITLSAFRPRCTFGHDFGVAIEDGPMEGLLARAVVVIRPDKKIIYAELVPEITHEPNYDGALEAIEMDQNN